MPRRLRNQVQRDTRMVATKLTDPELLVYGQQAAQLTIDMADKQDALKAHKQAAKAEIDELARERASLLARIGTRTEERATEVDIAYRWAADMVTVTRIDTGEIIEDRAMTFEERQHTMFDLDRQGDAPREDPHASERGDDFPGDAADGPAGD